MFPDCSTSDGPQGSPRTSFGSGPNAGLEGAGGAGRGTVFWKRRQCPIFFERRPDPALPPPDPRALRLLAGRHYVEMVTTAPRLGEPELHALPRQNLPDSAGEPPGLDGAGLPPRGTSLAPAFDPDRCLVSGQHERAVPFAVRHQPVVLCRLGRGGGTYCGRLEWARPTLRRGSAQCYKDQGGRGERSGRPTLGG